MAGVLAAVLAVSAWSAAAFSRVKASGSGAAWTFVSAPKLHPPRLQVLTHTAGLAQGDFLAASNGAGGASASGSQSGPLIMDDKARPVWFRPTPSSILDFEQETYLGAPVLVWIQGSEVHVVDRHYRRVAVLRARAPWAIDGHDASITGGDIWVTVVRRVSNQNLTAYGGPRDGSVLDVGVQEYRLSSGHLIRTWDALNPGGKANVPLSASEQPAGSGPMVNHGPKLWDAYHLNAVQALPDGDLLISMRNTWAVYLINPVTRGAVWTLGGKDSSFRLGSGTAFAWQHDARLIHPTQGGQGKNVELTLFNDNNGGPTAHPSAGLILSLNTIAHQATLVHAYRHHPPLSSGILGSMQLLPGGNALVGWGSEPYFSEYTSSGRKLLDVRWPGGNGSYRVLFTNTWVGMPYYPPRGAVRGRTVYASWNGATQVARWEVLAGSSASSLRVVATRGRTGFETAIRLGQSYGAYEVRALAASGRSLGSSKPFS